MKSGDGGPIRFLFAGDLDLAASILGKEEGGAKLDKGFAARVSERFGDRVAIEVVFEPCPDLATLLAALQTTSSVSLPLVQRMRNEGFNVLVTSLGADLRLMQPEMGTGSARAIAYLEQLLDFIRVIKQEFGSHLMIMNASTVDPTNHVSNFSQVQLEPMYLTANRLNLALIKASIEEGISIIDVDRLLAERGAAEHVHGFLDYSEAACSVICDELIRIVEDYGFFDDRPLLMQLGVSG